MRITNPGNSMSVAARLRLVALRAVAALVLVPVLTSSGLIMAQSDQVVPRDQVVLGKGLEEWSAEWQKWYISIPGATNPGFHSEIPCSNEQSGQVWFLPSGIDKSCVIRAGTLLLFTLINAECSNLEAPPFFGDSEPARRICAEHLLDDVGTSTLKLILDGVPITNLSRFRVQSPEFVFQAPINDNVLGVTGLERRGAGVTSGVAVSDGYFLFLQLAPGTHVVHAEATIVRGPFAGVSFITDYRLTQLGGREGR